MVRKSLIAQYKQKLSESLVERARGNVTDEERLLDELDQIWDSMSSEELAHAREFAKNITPPI